MMTTTSTSTTTAIVAPDCHDDGGTGLETMHLEPLVPFFHFFYYFANIYLGLRQRRQQLPQHHVATSPPTNESPRDV
jgi:hypothetical protein